MKWTSDFFLLVYLVFCLIVTVELSADASVSQPQDDNNPYSPIDQEETDADTAEIDDEFDDNDEEQQRILAEILANKREFRRVASFSAFKLRLDANTGRDCFFERTFPDSKLLVTYKVLDEAAHSRISAYFGARRSQIVYKRRRVRKGVFATATASLPSRNVTWSFCFRASNTNRRRMARELLSRTVGGAITLHFSLAHYRSDELIPPHDTTHTTHEAHTYFQDALIALQNNLMAVLQHFQTGKLVSMADELHLADLLRLISNCNMAKLGAVLAVCASQIHLIKRFF